MARKNRDEGSGYSWMDTYGDLVTLLMCFFVMLFAMSSVDAEKFAMLVKSFQSRGNETMQLILNTDGNGNDVAVNAGQAEVIDEKVNIEIPPVSFEQLYEYISEYVKENDMESTVTVEKSGANTVYIRFQDSIFFQPDKAELMPGSEGILEFLGMCLHSLQDQIMMIRVNGHTADLGPNFHGISEWYLSSGRAGSVVSFLETKAQVPAGKMTASGYGKNYPIAENKTEEGRQRNRRVELMILSNTTTEGTQADLEKLLNATITSDLFNDQLNPADVVIPNYSSSEASSSTSSGTSSGATPPKESSTAAPPKESSAPPPSSSGSVIPMP
ncbi:MAG: flagellar motor protein MotB [Angelakisella sp.]